MGIGKFRYDIFSIWLILFFYGTTGHSQVLINEFQASNVSTIRNPVNAEYSDWIELVNEGDTLVDISGYYLTDDKERPDKWQIEFDTIIPPDSYILFWADDRDEFNHTNFRLGRSGEFIGFYNNEGVLLDSISFGFQEDDMSFGRAPDQITNWVIFEEASPGKPNTSNYLSGKASDPIFSHQGGFYDHSLSLTLTSVESGSVIYYTLDGTDPDSDDMLYSSPLMVDSTLAIRVRAYSDGKLPGNIITQTFFINEPVNLPFVSLVTDPKNFFDDSTGIYVIGTNGRPGYCTDAPMNVNQDWERPVNIELYDKSGVNELNQMAGVKIFGGCSRTRYPLKSLALYARAEYGKGSFECQLFKDKPIDRFESFILRTSGDDVVHTMFKDGMAQTLLEEMDIDRQAYRPAVVFINGEYWGIHNIREKINEHYVAGNYQIDADEVNLIKGNKLEDHNVMHGSAEDYHEMIRYVQRQNLSDERVYQYVATQMDINNYIDYQIAEIYLSANDWPMNNIKYWNSNTGYHTRWRWIIYDLDNCFKYTDWNTIDLATDPWCDCTWPNPPESTLLFRKLLENESFRNEFIQRYAWHMNTTFDPLRVNGIIDSIKLLIQPEIPRHIDRWGGKMVPEPEFWISPLFASMEEWERNIDIMKDFVENRAYHARQHVIDYFSNDGTESLIYLEARVEDPAGGYLKIQDQRPVKRSHEGIYFSGIPINIKAIPFMGQHFKYWEYEKSGEAMEVLTNPSIQIIPEEDIRITAYFEPAENRIPPVVINEINYHSADSPDPGDWLELYNNSPDIVDLESWTFLDENDDHVFQFTKGEELEPYSYLVITEDIGAFRNVFPDVTNVTGNLGFGLSNAGEIIRLFAQEGVLVDQVTYDDESPWPSEPDGEGPTLELLNPDLDNGLAENWKISFETGTPGKQNFSNSINDFTLYPNYPNPFSGQTTIHYAVESAGFVTIIIYNSQGRKITSLVNTVQEKSDYRIIWAPENLKNGLYFYSLFVDQKLIDTKKMLLIR